MPLQHSASEELDDYSGPFEPDLRIQDFSKQGLIKLVQIGGEIYGAVNRQWYATQHGLGRVTDIQLVNYEAGKYRREQAAGPPG